MYVVSPWSKGGWVSSETFDHTSVGQFLEQRFDLTIPAISPWHRAMCGDLTSCFDFSMEGDRAFPPLPDASGSVAILTKHLKRPKMLPPRAEEERFQEAGLRRSRALPYILHVDARAEDGKVTLNFVNEGSVGATFHVYDRKDLNRVPRRYAVEAGKSLKDHRSMTEDGSFDLYVMSHNGFMRAFTSEAGGSLPNVIARHDNGSKALALSLDNSREAPARLTLGQDQYGANSPLTLTLAPDTQKGATWPAAESHGWYDFTIEVDGATIRLAGRIEDGQHSVSDPLMQA